MFIICEYFLQGEQKKTTTAASNINMHFLYYICHASFWYMYTCLITRNCRFKE